MENKVLEQNLKQIKHYDSDLVNEILMFNDEKSNIQLAQNYNGEYNLLYEDIPLHSVNGAIEEANSIVQDLIDENNSIKIIYGLGLGYLLDSASIKLKQSKIIVYEPNIDILKYTLSIAQLNALSEDNVFICSSKEKFKEHIFNFVNENTKISISFLNSYKSFMEDIKAILFDAQSIQGEIIGNKNTLINFGEIVFKTTIFNLARTIQNPNITQLKDIYKGKTALILCAGPSLEENIDIIKKNQDKFILFALNPTLKLLQKHQIDPDFVIAIESTYIAKQFEGVDTKKYHFILEPSVCCSASKLETKKTFNYISKNNFFNNWVRECLSVTDDIKPAGTVSHTAFSSAFLMGFEKIILIGQDLAYKDGSCYSKGCQWSNLECIYDKNEKKYKIIANDFEKFTEVLRAHQQTYEEAKKEAQNHIEHLNNNLCTIKSTDGKDIPSKTDYVIFIKCFENSAEKIKKENPNIELINASFGAQINGFKNIRLSEIVKNLKPIEKLNLQNYKANFNKENAIKKIDKLIKQLKEYQILFKDFISINEKILASNNDEYYDSIKKHNEILSNIIKMKDDEEAGFIVTIHLIQNEKIFNSNYFENKEITKSTLEKINQIYGKLDDEVNQYIIVLGNCKSFILK